MLLHATIELIVYCCVAGDKLQPLQYDAILSFEIEGRYQRLADAAGE